MAAACWLGARGGCGALAVALAAWACAPPAAAKTPAFKCTPDGSTAYRLQLTGTSPIGATCRVPGDDQPWQFGSDSTCCNARDRRCPCVPTVAVAYAKNTLGVRALGQTMNEVTCLQSGE